MSEERYELTLEKFCNDSVRTFMRQVCAKYALDIPENLEELISRATANMAPEYYSTSDKLTFPSEYEVILAIQGAIDDEILSFEGTIAECSNGWLLEALSSRDPKDMTDAYWTLVQYAFSKLFCAFYGDPAANIYFALIRGAEIARGHGP